MKKVIIFGNNNVAKILYFESLKFPELLNIEAFCVNREFLDSDTFCSKPLVSAEDLVTKYPPEKYNGLISVLSQRNLRNRMKVFDEIKKYGYDLINYTSPMAIVAPDVQLGENNIIFPFSFIGIESRLWNANVIWNGVTLDHNTTVGNGNFFAGGCKLAGSVTVGNSCWIGLNSTIIQQINIADETLVGAGAVVIKDTNKHTTYAGNPARIISTHEETGIMID